MRTVGPVVARVLVLIAVGASLFSCASAPAAATVPLDSRFVLSPGAVASVEGASMRVRFDRVEEDSRCPTDVVCIQAGDAVVRITVIQDDGATRSYQLHTNGEHSATHGQLTIQLEDLVPQPVSTHSIASGDYRASLRVRR